MCELTPELFCKTTVQGMNFYMHTKRIRSKTGASRTKKWGINYISRAPVQLSLVNVTLLKHRLKLYQIYDHLLSIHPERDSKRLFLQMNRKEAKPKVFCETRNLVKVLFCRAIKTVCNEVKMDQEWMDTWKITAYVYIWQPCLSKHAIPTAVKC